MGLEPERANLRWSSTRGKLGVSLRGHTFTVCVSAPEMRINASSRADFFWHLWTWKDTESSHVAGTRERLAVTLARSPSEGAGARRV